MVSVCYIATLSWFPPLGLRLCPGFHRRLCEFLRFGYDLFELNEATLVIKAYSMMEHYPRIWCHFQRTVRESQLS